MEINEIRERLKYFPKKKEIEQAKLQEELIRMHTEISFENTKTHAINRFFGWVDNLISSDKRILFRKTFDFPIVTHELTETIFSRLYRIFYGRNRSYSALFINNELAEDWRNYSAEINITDFLKNDVFCAIKTEHNGLAVIDLPQEQEGDKPEPYVYILPISQVLDYEFERNSDTELRHVLFQTHGDRVAFFDKQFIRLFNDAKANELEREVEHGIGMCPARFLFSEPISRRKKGVKKSPLSTQISKLNFYAFFSTSKKIAELYAAYPIYSGYQSECDYFEQDKRCSGGIIVDTLGKIVYDNTGTACKCPKCEKNRIIGAGSFISIPPPANGVDMRNPIQKLSADVVSLEYLTEEQTRLKNEIIDEVCGVAADVIAETSINEKQVKATFEQQTDVLIRWAKQFELLQVWIEETMCRLRYGEQFVSIDISYGTDFYTDTVSDLKNALKNPYASLSERRFLRRSIIENEQKNNSTENNRQMLLLDLEPFIDYTFEQIVQLRMMGSITEEEFQYKLRFNSLISQFEAEFMSIEEFGENLTYAEKLREIKRILLTYINN